MSQLRKEAQEKAKSLRKQLAVLDKLTGGASERERDVERKRAQRAASKEVIIPACADRARRETLEADDIAWLMHYFGTGCGLKDPFWYEFTTQQREMISAIRHAILFGGDQAIAASRSQGKPAQIRVTGRPAAALCRYRQTCGRFSRTDRSFWPRNTTMTDMWMRSSAYAATVIKPATSQQEWVLEIFAPVCVPKLASSVGHDRSAYQTAT